MRKRILSALLFLCMAVTIFACLPSAAAADVAVTGISTAGKTVLEVGETARWTASVLPKEATNKWLHWAAGNPGVASVDQNGNIKALKAGQCNITITANNGVKKTLLLTVKEVAVTGISTAGKTVLGVGETARWTASVLPKNATNKQLRWAAGNPGVATVDQNGNIKTHKAGQCNITITANNGVKKTLLLTVVQKVPLFTQDGRVIEVLPGDVEKNVKVGWSKTASKLTIKDSGAVGSVTWEFGNGVMYVGGTGEIPYGFNSETGCKDTMGALYIKRGITSLHSFAFDGSSKLWHVEIPDTVTSIGSYAFDDAQITRIGIPASVTVITGGSFDTYGLDSPNSCNRNMTIYGQTGSAAQRLASECGLKFVPSTCVYNPDGRTMMVSDAERSAYLRNGWYAYPVRLLYSKDGRTLACNLLDVAANKKVGWHEKSEVYTTLYALDGRSQDFLNTKVDANRKVGWYYYEDYVAAKANQIAKASGYNAAVEFAKAALEKSGLTTAQAEKIRTTIANLYSGWQKVAGAPLIAMGNRVRHNSINVPEPTISIKNLSKKTVTAFELEFTCYDAYGAPTSDAYYINTKFTGYVDDTVLAPEEQHGYTWTLYHHERTTQIKNIRIMKVAYADGTVWKR